MRTPPTKSAVIGFSDALRREVSDNGIQVTALCPGFVATNFSPRLKKIAEGRPDAQRLPGVMQADYVADRIASIIRRPRRRVLSRRMGAAGCCRASVPQVTDAALSRYVEAGRMKPHALRGRAILAALLGAMLAGCAATRPGPGPTSTAWVSLLATPRTLCQSARHADARH